MPGQVQKAAAFNVAASLRTHAADPVQQREDFTELPPGIVNGTAELREAKLGVYKKSPANDKNGLTGQRFIFLAGVVITPAEHTWRPKRWGIEGGKPQVVYDPPKTVKTQGLRTNQTVAIFCQRSYKGRDGQMHVISADEQTAAALNELKMIDPHCCDPLAKLPANCTEAQALAVLQSILDGLKRARPHIRFGTNGSEVSAANPAERSWPRWYGSAGSNGQMPPANNAPPAVQDETPAADEPPAETPADTGEVNIADLVARADSEQEAGERLLALAVEAGIAEDAARNTGSWQELADMIAAAGTPEETPPAEGEGDAPPATPEEPEWEPAKGEVYDFRLLDKEGQPVKNPKTGKPYGKVKVSITSVSKANKTVDVLSTIDKKTKWAKQPWDALIRE